MFTFSEEYTSTIVVPLDLEAEAALHMHQHLLKRLRQAGKPMATVPHLSPAYLT